MIYKYLKGVRYSLLNFKKKGTPPHDMKMKLILRQVIKFVKTKNNI